MHDDREKPIVKPDDNVANFNAFLHYFRGICLVTVGNKYGIRIKSIRRQGTLWECELYHTTVPGEALFVKAGSPVIVYLE